MTFHVSVYGPQKVEHTPYRKKSLFYASQLKKSIITFILCKLVKIQSLKKEILIGQT